MNVKKVIKELKQNFPGKNIILNNKDNPTEIICEIETNSRQSKAIAVIDQSIPHFHLKATEEYTVIKGRLILTIETEDHTIPEGQSYIIYPGQHHSAKGDETWIDCVSVPAWSPEDHILVDPK